MNDQELELEHYGTPRHSGRYPWGSGENPYQRDVGFLGRIKAYKDAGVPEKEMAKLEGITMRELRAKVTLYGEQQKTSQKGRVRNLKEKGYTAAKISEITGVSEGTVRNWLKEDGERKKNSIASTKAALKEAVDQKAFIDVGKGSEIYLGVSSTRLDAAVKSLVADGYVYHKFKQQQLGTGHETTFKVLCPPGTTYGELMTHLENYTLLQDPYSTEHRATRPEIKEPVSIDPKRVSIRYAEDGGKDMDGVIQLRRGVEDLSMKGSRYAQVRIKVGDDMYLKGMAMYADDLPKGVDIVFNTNKKTGTPFEDVLKGVKDEETESSKNNPFGATIYQFDYDGKDGKPHQSPLNLVYKEGQWDTWSRTLSSQFMSKQPVPLAQRQLTKAYEDKKQEYDDIMKVQNPVIRRKLLEEFSDSCDSDAVNLKAAQMPRQNSQVILPFPGIKEDEIYAPNYRDGEKVVLIRHPHAGPFEIPTLTVNNKYGPAQEVIKNAKDAVGIHPKTAAILSGADFDGDTVVVIPNNQGEIRTKNPLKGLKDFDPQTMYPAYEGMSKVGPETGFHKGAEMGKVSNLITDMTIKGATDDEIAAAVRHSMVVIDAEKHNLDWRQSYKDNNIAALTAKYEGVGERGRLKGASTAISRAKRKEQVDERAQWFFSKGTIDPETGEKIYRETGRTYQKAKRDKDNNVILDPETGKPVMEDKVYKYKTTVRAMEKAKDAREISSGGAFEIENVYVDYANKMKALANEARKSWLDAETVKVNSASAKIYSEEVKSLKDKLNFSVKNSPIERYAQLKANLVVQAKIKANPSLKTKDKAEQLKRLKHQELERARTMYGSVSRKNRNIEITPREWEAINAQAITSSMLNDILKNMDSKYIKNLATPRQQTGLTSAQIARAKTMLAGNRTQAEVADALGVSISTLNNYLK